MQEKPWVSFCISTYRRPQMLESQLRLLLQQTSHHFEIIISDNDPDGSGRMAVDNVNDPRIKYWKNAENLGMIKSFNKSIERSNTEYVVMLTDDDPVAPDFLQRMATYAALHPGLSVYCGFLRPGKPGGEIELIDAQDFCAESLDPDRTSNLLWSSALLRREDVIAIGSIPDYGSPHLADHALLALTGSVKGALICNEMFSTLSSHESNFSKSNLSYYLNGCSGFYNVMMDNRQIQQKTEVNNIVIRKHLSQWFFANFFTLRKYYVLNKVNRIQELDEIAESILKFPYMKNLKLKYRFKRSIFAIKKITGLLK